MTEKIGTWNVFGLNDKEPEIVEIVEIMTQHNISVMGILDSGRKGKGHPELEWTNPENNYFQVYAPSDSYTEEGKDSLSQVPDKEEIVVMSDFNGRVGRTPDPWTAHLVPHSNKNKDNIDKHR